MNLFKSKRFSKWLNTFLIAALLLQVSMASAIINPSKVKAETPSGANFYASSSDGSGALYRANITGAPDDTYSTIQTETQHVVGKTFDTTGRTENITKVVIVGEYHITGTYTDDKFKLSHNMGSTTKSVDADSETDIQVKQDVTADHTWTWSDIADLEVRANLEATGDTDNIDILVDALWVQVTYDVATPLNVKIGIDKKVTNSTFTQNATVTGGTGELTYTWTQTDGPGTITFGTSDAEDTTITADTDGIYTITLTAADDSSDASDSFELVWDTTAPEITNAAFTADGNAMNTDLTGAFILDTDEQDDTDYSLQFSSNVTSTEILANNMFALNLINTTVDKNVLKQYYEDRGMPSDYLTYLKNAVDGLNPFAFINGSTLKLHDGAKYTIDPPTSDDLNMTIPGDYPEGTYTLAGNIADTAGNTTTVTYKLIINSTGPVLTLDQTAPQYDAASWPGSISGTATDAVDVNDVTVKIEDETASKFWNAGTQIWEDTATENAATLTDNTWSLDFYSTNLTYGSNYKVHVRATDKLGKESSTDHSFVYAIEAPTSTIDLDAFVNANYNDEITGTATYAGTLDKVEMSISYQPGDDTLYWNENEQNWTTTEIWLTYNFPTISALTNEFAQNWEFAFPSEHFTDLETYTVKTKASGTNNEDASQTQVTPTTQTFFYDSVSPEGEISINDGATITSNATVTISNNITDNDSVNFMRFSESELTESDNWETFSATKDWTFSSNGQKTLYAQFKDRAGNVHSTNASIYYNNAATNIQEFAADNTTKELTYGNVTLTGDPIATTTSTVTFSQYTKNPEGGHAGITAFGKYFDISINPATALVNDGSVQVKIWFTQSDLDNAGITNPGNQIQGLYFWNGSAWELYAETGITMENNAGYIGYVWANVTHFTPMMTGADVTAPVKPANFKGEVQDGAVKLSWDKVSDAKGYNIRYRKPTNNDATESYSYIYLSGSTSTEYTISGLTNDQLYEFGVQATDDAGNEGVWAVINVAPSQSTTDKTSGTIVPTTAYKSYFGIGTAAAATDNQDEATDDETDDKTEIETITPEGNVEGAEDDAEEASKAVVTLAILIIAAGAGLGGYYGYQWWLGKETVETTVKTKKDAGKKNKGGRW